MNFSNTHARIFLCASQLFLELKTAQYCTYTGIPNLNCSIGAKSKIIMLGWYRGLNLWELGTTCVVNRKGYQFEDAHMHSKDNGDYAHKGFSIPVVCLFWLAVAWPT